MPAFPKDLARSVFNRWNRLVGGDYVTPPCPPLNLLIQLMEICCLAACSPEEARYPQFNVLAIPEDCAEELLAVGKRWAFTTRRPLNVEEVRRLAPAADLKKSALWVVWDEQALWIYGLVDLGTSWHRARVGLGYWYNPPPGLLIEVDRPGRMRVYQGTFHVATLADGEIQRVYETDFNLFLHSPANAGLARMNEIDTPAYEHPRDYVEFEFIALWNTYAAIANAISLAGHGGMLIIANGDIGVSLSTLRLKYESNSTVLRDAYIEFMSARHLLGDYIALLEDEYTIPQDALYRADAEMKLSYEKLVEATRFVARLSSCDGSIVISDDLRLIGFGGEIRAELAPDTEIFDVKHEAKRETKPCDIEQFGMRHRSAVKLASQEHDCKILVISQDGPITAVWWEKDRVLVKKRVHLANMNMPLA